MSILLKRVGLRYDGLSSQDFAIIIYPMRTVSILISSEEQKFIEAFIKSGQAENEIHVMQQALRLLKEETLLQKIFQAQSEPNIKGNLRELIKVF